LYSGRSVNCRSFFYALLAFDVASLLFIIATSFLPRNDVVRGLDITFGFAFLIELVFRLAGSRRLDRELLPITTWTDVAAIASLLAATASKAAGFLRVLRTLRLLRTFRVMQFLREDSAFFRRNEELLFAVTNLSVFIFVMTGVVYETQRGSNPGIHNYADALYFTVTALTTTGFGQPSEDAIIARGKPERLMVVPFRFLTATDEVHIHPNLRMRVGQVSI
jgi:voltage-gated potassium channel